MIWAIIFVQYLIKVPGNIMILGMLLYQNVNKNLMHLLEAKRHWNVALWAFDTGSWNYHYLVPYIFSVLINYCCNFKIVVRQCHSQCIIS